MIDEPVDWRVAAHYGIFLLAVVLNSVASSALLVRRRAAARGERLSARLSAVRDRRRGAERRCRVLGARRPRSARALD